MLSQGQTLCVRNIRKPTEARVLYEPMRREILRLLCKTPMTQTQLAKALGLQVPTVGHHLSTLRSHGFVSMTHQQVGKHGILEKYYESTAQLFFIDRSIMPLEVRRYYMSVDIERARGVLACAMMREKDFDPPSELMENFAESLSTHISKIGYRYERPISDKDPEVVIGRIYCEALEDVLKTDFKELRTVLSRN